MKKRAQEHQQPSKSKTNCSKIRESTQNNYKFYLKIIASKISPNDFSWPILLWQYEQPCVNYEHEGEKAKEVSPSASHVNLLYMSSMKRFEEFEIGLAVIMRLFYWIEKISGNLFAEFPSVCGINWFDRHTHIILKRALWNNWRISLKGYSSF